MIFPTKSPVDRSGGTSDVKTPNPIKRAKYRRLADRLAKQIIPLLSSKRDVDQVYSNGYFENHYPEADKKLKRVLHDKVMADWANALNEDEDEDEEKEEKKSKRVFGDGTLTININLG